MINKIDTLIFGCNSLIGSEISKRINKKKTLLVSRKKPKSLVDFNWIKIDLNSNKDLEKIPKNVKKIYFLSSPYFILKNFKIHKYELEYKWLKKILKKINFDSFIYFSSSSVYLKKHPVGIIKRKCEKLLLNKKIKSLQIWRPFNIIGNNENILSDHFHNLLIKKFIFEKKKSYCFFGNKNDVRGYSSAKKLSRIVLRKSKSKSSFILNYGNQNTISILQIVKIFLKIFEKKYKKNIQVSFKSSERNINTINSTNNIKTVKSEESSKNLLKNYFLKFVK